MTGHYLVQTDGAVLADMRDEVRLLNQDKGWFVTERTFGDDIALLHSEVSEALEAWRSYRSEDATATDVDRDPMMAPPKPEGIGSEFADVLVRLLDTCSRYDIDLFAEWRRKMDYNWTRPTRHGGKTL